MLAFAARYPGALAAHFLCQVRSKLLKREPGKMADLQVDLAQWTSSAGLKELRDIREIQALSMILTELNHARIQKAADIIAMRIREVRAAKGTGGSWEKAASQTLAAARYVRR